MEKPMVIIKECPILGGYTLTVKDDWSYKLKAVNITENEKEAYLKDFGENIITYNEFFDWWKKFNGKALSTSKVGLV
ncbi:MAG: hypothetical protein IIU11_00665 [Bacteroidales bacterium]|jgi:hypothetical protein|nr:hypothetical protein [Bacteroidales bacterium]